MARRLLSIWFPRLASDLALRRRPVDGPFALILRAGQADHLHCLNAAASAQGLYAGMPLADARAICPELVTHPADLVAQAAGLTGLRRWAGRYAPLVARDGADGLLADITGAAHLFGGEAGLRDDLQGRLARLGMTAQSAIAGTRGAAHAVARHGGGIAGDDLEQAVAVLPVAALRIDHDSATGLARLGLVRIGDLMAQPRAPLARRFGAGLMLRLDQMLGRQPEPISPEADPTHFGVRMTLPEPIGLQSDVMAGLMRLLERLCAHLARHQCGARRLSLELRRVDRASVTVQIGLARPMRDPAQIARLFARGIEDVDAGFGIDAMRLAALVTEPMVPEQIDGEKQDDALADLISRLGNRIGFDRVLRMQPADSLIPERSFTLMQAAHSVPATGWPKGGPPRPILIFPPEPVAGVQGHPPETFRWRRMDLTTHCATGPERIAPEWWGDDPAWRTGLRDYWRIDTRQGPRLWLFHTPQVPAWHCHGVFA
ncbi:MAG: DNA polymerase Y family protein [Paracoccus sp. (in: a-proteobacteria)]|nr:DNA polymerase Y family protein [Paracoccus sp. (in: a-proteobacteria)]